MSAAGGPLLPAALHRDLGPIGTHAIALREGGWHLMFHGVSLRLLHNPSLDSLKPLFARLREDGCDSIAIIPHH